VIVKNIALFVLITGITQVALAQAPADSKEPVRKGRPDIPGTFVIDFGLSMPFENDPRFNTGIWGSRSVNLYYQVDKRIAKSKFSVHPGAGLGMERYKFNNNNSFTYKAGPTGPYDSLKMVPGSEILGSDADVRKSQLITNYADALVEFRFSTNPNDPARSFKVSLGFKGGLLFDSFTKMKYSQDGETKKIKDKQDFNLNTFRYGVTLRVGAGNFNAFGYYSVSTLFEKGKGPSMNEINNFTVGISLAAF
jgi:hypothetical protein